MSGSFQGAHLMASGILTQQHKEPVFVTGQFSPMFAVFWCGTKENTRAAGSSRRAARSAQVPPLYFEGLEFRWGSGSVPQRS